MPRIFPCLAAVILTAMLSGCCPCMQPVTAAASSAPQCAPVVVHNSVLLSGVKTGDALHVTIAKQPDLSGTYTIASDGTITMPLAGKIAVAGQSVGALPGVIVDAYKQGYLIDPKVSVEVKTQ